MMRSVAARRSDRPKKVPVNRFIDLVLVVFLALFPLFAKTFQVEMMGRYIALSIFAVSLDLLWGYMGLLSLGHAVFFGIGGYMIGLCYQIQHGLPSFMTREKITQLPWFYLPLKNPALAVILGIAIAALMGALLGFFVFSSKIKGVFFTIITLALATMFYQFIITEQKYTNGFNGLQNIRRFAVGSGAPLTKRQYYYVILAVGVAVFLFCIWFTKSRVGKVAVSIRENEERLRYFGYKTSHYKILILTISCAMAGLAGALYAPATSSITPVDIGVSASTAVVVWIAVGGRGNLTGAVIGTLLINWAQSLLSDKFANVWQLILGVVLLLIIFFIPDGIIGQLVKLQKRCGKQTPHTEKVALQESSTAESEVLS
ncbi:MAG: urea ABC transporter permease subunit UrtC [Oscillospiraceae bacterium]|jgi:urea transport system permease protein|nr:urea ABC transporter permease subunit UrtC [Oscillospiraceae bacterium]